MTGKTTGTRVSPQARAERIRSAEKTIIKHLQDNGNISVSHAINISEVPRTMIDEVLKNLSASGFISRTEQKGKYKAGPCLTCNSKENTELQNKILEILHRHCCKHTHVSLSELLQTSRQETLEALITLHRQAKLSMNFIGNLMIVGLPEAQPISA